MNGHYHYALRVQLIEQILFRILIINIQVSLLSHNYYLYIKIVLHFILLVLKVENFLRPN